MKFLAFVPFSFVLAFSGPNQNAVLSVDLLPGTGTSDSTLSLSKDSGAFWVAVRVSQAVGLDSYGFELGYDRTLLTFIQAYAASLPDGFPNFLESLGGNSPGFIGRVSQWDSSSISVAHSLIGSDSTQSPSGSGILALLRFQPRGIAGNALFSVGAVQLLDWRLQLDTVVATVGARLTLTTVVRISQRHDSRRSGVFPSTVFVLAGYRDLLGRRPMINLK